MLLFRGFGLNTILGIMMMLILSSNSWAQDDSPSYMFGVNSLDSTLSVYRLTAEGIPRQQSFYPTAKNPKAVAVHPSGKFLYAVAKTANAVVAYQVVYRPGRLELQNPKSYTLAAASAFSLVIHPTGKFLYVAAREGKIAAYAIDPDNGSLTPVISSPFAAQNRTRSLVVHPSGEFLYAVNAYANSICAYRVDAGSGRLTPVPGSPFAVAGADMAKRSLWALADVPQGAGGIPYFLAIEPQGRYVYVSNWGAGKISAFAIDRHTGALTEVPGSPFDTGLNPYAIAVHPSGRYLYAGSWQTNSLWAYRIDPQTGALSALAKKSFPTGGRSPVAIVFGSGGTMAYVANSESANISSLRIDTGSGDLTLLQTTQTRPGPWSLTPPLTNFTKPSGFALYTLDRNARQLALWSIPLQDYALKSAQDKVQAKDKVRAKDKAPARLIDAVALPAGDLWAVREALGSVYAADIKRKTISAFRLDKASRKLVKVDNSPWRLTGTPAAMQVGSNGWYLYVTTQAPDTVQVFGIDSRTGELLALTQPLALGFTPTELVLGPAGRYAYVFSANRRQVSLFSYRQNTGPMVYERTRFGSPFQLKSEPSTANIDPGGEYMLLSKGESQTVSVYQIHALSGAIREITGSPFHTETASTEIFLPDNGNFIYGFDAAAAKLYVYPRDALSGEIGARHSSALDLSKSAISAISVQGDLLLIADKTAKTVSIYLVSPDSGGLGRIAEYKLPGNVDGMVLTTADWLDNP